MASNNPAHIVAPSKVVALKDSVQVVADAEAAQSRNTNSLDALTEIGLEDIDSKIRYIRHVSCRPAIGGLARVAEAEIVQQARRENVTFVKQIILIHDGVSSIGVIQDVRRIE